MPSTSQARDTSDTTDPTGTSATRTRPAAGARIAPWAPSSALALRWARAAARLALAALAWAST